MQNDISKIKKIKESRLKKFLPRNGTEFSQKKTFKSLIAIL